jgi:hypothetical protein
MVIGSYLTEIENMASDDVFNCGSSLTIKLSDAPQKSIQNQVHTWGV